MPSMQAPTKQKIFPDVPYEANNKEENTSPLQYVPPHCYVPTTPIARSHDFARYKQGGGGVEARFWNR